MVKSRAWYVFFTDHHDREHSFAASTDKEAAKSLELKVKSLVSCRESSYYPPDMQSWIDQLPSKLKDKLLKWGLLDGCRVAATKLLAEHLQDWRAALVAKGSMERHAILQHARVSRVFSEAGFIFYQDVQASKLLETIESLHKLQPTINGPRDTGKLISPRTKHHHLRACKQFATWMNADRRVNSNSIEHLSMSNKIETQNPRRALTRDEVNVLLDHVGPVRALLYRFAIETGLRANEIRSLTRTSFDFDGLTVKVEARHTKNRKTAALPLKTTTAKAIKEASKLKAPTATIFNVPKTGMAKIIKRDIKNARKEWIQIAVNNPDEYRRRAESEFLKIKTDAGKLDFHALRHTFGTLLAASGVHPKTAQELMRHSDINLTMGIYTHAQTEQVKAAINDLPDFQKQVQIMTGTDGDNFTPCPTPDLVSKHVQNCPTLAKMGDENGGTQNGQNSPITAISAQKSSENAIRPRGLEPLTFGLGNQCSILLSYERKCEKTPILFVLRLVIYKVKPLNAKIMLVFSQRDR